MRKILIVFFFGFLVLAVGMFYLFISSVISEFYSFEMQIISIGVMAYGLAIIGLATAFRFAVSKYKNVD